MGQIYLGINYGTEGWTLTPYDIAAKALRAVKDGETYGNEWKILRELDIKVDETERDDYPCDATESLPKETP